MDTVEALKSENWLNVSCECVQEFLRMDTLTGVKETDLLRALLRWGEFQVKQDGDNPEDGEKLRSKIEPGLQLIRFYQMDDNREFARLCCSRLELVLSLEEQHAVFMAIAGFGYTLSRSTGFLCTGSRRQAPFAVCQFPKYVERESAVKNPRGGHETTMSFSINRNAYFQGLEFRNPYHTKIYELKDSCGKIIGEAWSGAINRHGGTRFLEVNPSSVPLDAHKTYTLTFKFPFGCAHAFRDEWLSAFELNSHENPIKSEWLEVKVVDSSKCVAKLDKMLFQAM